jgi:hypothetical protein
MTYIRDIPACQKHLSDGLTQLAEQIVPQGDQSTLPDSSQCLLDKRNEVKSQSRAFQTSPEKKKELACFPERLLGRAGNAIRCRPTPIAPELTRTTLCPAARRRTTVSTMAERVERSGWCVVSCTIDDVPASHRARTSGKESTCHVI